ncbi:glycogen synthase kinase 3 beta [Nematocida ausubeli]|nr:glycogen synthase kinase 3 beta [Nematocida ausubeli]KAI5136281.1 glycogen synthase kinase 3 beta [Nematocida ausubeli]KAI5150983.1 glycogen synthase kinase 3 beta [Nematocida ausubeli]KAI5163655.1 glycogen synthase kinase 3 beta [Nematocida ausubeli]
MDSSYMLSNIGEEDNKELEESMTCAATGQTCQIKYYAHQKIGSGTFGMVYRILVNESVSYALKRVFEKREYLNRELDILCSLSHPNIIRLFWYFYGERNEKGVVLNLVTDYIKSDAFLCIQDRRFFSRDEFIMYAIMLMEGLSYMHGLGIAHRDIKPSNILIDTDAQILKICDLGSAKKIVGSASNILYICSRYYRAPEIHMGLSYDLSIDVWGAGCVLFELLTHHALFPGRNSEECLEVIKYFILQNGLANVIKNTERNDLDDCFSILRKMLAYEPSKRLTALEALILFKGLQNKPS